MMCELFGVLGMGAEASTLQIWKPHITGGLRPQHMPNIGLMLLSRCL